MSALLVSGTLTLDTTERNGVVYDNVPGGSALYAAAAGRLLLPTRIAGTVGTDFPFDDLRTLWTGGPDPSLVQAIDPSDIEVLAGPTFRWHARYASDGEERVTLSRDPGVAAGRLPPVPRMPDSNYALLLGSSDPRLQTHVRDATPDAGLVGLDSMAHWWKERPDALHSLLGRVDVVFVDEGELTLATDSPHGVDAANELLRRGPAIVVVKRASQGAWLLRRDQAPMETSAVVLPSVADTTGAGDAFAGAFMAAQGRWPERGDDYALRFATAVASFAVEGVGTSALARVDLSALHQRMDALVVSRC